MHSDTQRVRWEAELGGVLQHDKAYYVLVLVGTGDTDGSLSCTPATLICCSLTITQLLITSLLPSCSCSHCHYLTPLALALTISLSPPHSQSHSHCCCLTISLSPSHSHCCCLTLAVSPSHSHSHHLTLTVAVSLWLFRSGCFALAVADGAGQGYCSLGMPCSLHSTTLR